MKILFIDTETGGLDPNVQSILSIGLAVWNDGAVEATRNIWIAEQEIVADPAALKVNGIDIDWLRTEGKGVNNAAMEIENFLLENNLSKSPVMLGGHNVQFDVGFLKRLYRLAGRDFSKTFSYRSVCTQVLAIACTAAGLTKFTAFSGDKVFTHFHCAPERVNGKHEALGDAIASAKAFTGMTNLMKKA